MSKRVLFIISRTFLPITGGREVVIYNYIKGLNEKYECKVDVVGFFNENEKIQLKKLDFINEAYKLEKVGSVDKMKNLILNTIIYRKWPIQVSLFYSNSVQKNINSIIESSDYDIIICDMVRTAEYVKNNNQFNGKRILDMDDLLSNRYKRQSKNFDSNSNILGQYKDKVPKFINRLVNNKVIGRWVLNIEAKLLRRYEISIAKDYDNIIFVSKNEAIQLNKEIGENKSIDITIGVDYDYYSTQVEKKKSYNIIGFLGNMYIPHNIDAVESFISNVFPKIKKNMPDVKFRIIGKCSEQFKNKYKESSIEVTGFVEDIRPYVQECVLTVAPLKFGSGVKTKILETLAMGVPVITNDIGVEGIAYNDEILVANTDDELINCILSVMKNQKLRNELEIKSKMFIKNNYTWDITLANFKDIINKEKI